MRNGTPTQVLFGPAHDVASPEEGEIRTKPNKAAKAASNDEKVVTKKTSGLNGRQNSANFNSSAPQATQSILKKAIGENQEQPATSDHIASQQDTVEAVVQQGKDGNDTAGALSLADISTQKLFDELVTRDDDLRDWLEFTTYNDAKVRALKLLQWREEKEILETERLLAERKARLAKVKDEVTQGNAKAAVPVLEISAAEPPLSAHAPSSGPKAKAGNNAKGPTPVRNFSNKRPPTEDPTDGHERPKKEARLDHDHKTPYKPRHPNQDGRYGKDGPPYRPQQDRGSSYERPGSRDRPDYDRDHPGSGRRFGSPDSGSARYSQGRFPPPRGRSPEADYQGYHDRDSTYDRNSNYDKSFKGPRPPPAPHSTYESYRGTGQRRTRDVVSKSRYLDFGGKGG